jgi:hypothetical protein
MITLTVSFKPDGSSAEVIAQVVKLLAGVEASHLPASTSEVIDTGIVLSKGKVAKPKKVRKPLTEEEKEVIRQRFAEGRRKAAIARGEIVPEPVKAPKAITPGTPEANAKIKAAIKKSVAKSEKAALPKKGQKVVAKPTA